MVSLSGLSYTEVSAPFETQLKPFFFFFFAGLGSSLPAKKAGAPIHTGTIVGIVLAVLLIAAIILAGIYINSHPTSNAALFFIEVSGKPQPRRVFSSSALNTNLEKSREQREEERGTLAGSYQSFNLPTSSLMMF